MSTRPTLPSFLLPPPALISLPHHVSISNISSDTFPTTSSVHVLFLLPSLHSLSSSMLLSLTSSSYPFLSCLSVSINSTLRLHYSPLVQIFSLFSFTLFPTFFYFTLHSCSSTLLHSFPPPSLSTLHITLPLRPQSEKDLYHCILLGVHV